jgi:CheY-like chemotaxis protein
MLEESRSGVRVLVADDDKAARMLYVTLLTDVAGVDTVVAAADGTEAVRCAKVHALDLAVLDLNMPRLDGVAAAQELLALQPSLAVALHSSDPADLHRRARGLGALLFDKLGFEELVAWVEAEVAVRRPLLGPAR